MGEYYGLTLTSLCKLMEYSGQEGVIEINKLGGVEGICEKLCTSPSEGLTNSIERRRNTFGSNYTSTEKARETFGTILCDVFCDKVLVTLLILSFLFFGIHKWICVVVVIFVTITVDYFILRKYRCYFDVGSQSKEVTVIRNATSTNIIIDDIVVGDVCIINTNNVVPADGILIESDGLKIDESFINGVSCYTKKGEHHDAMILCGSEVMAGSGTMVVTAVGANTRKGQISKLMEKRAKKGKSDQIVSGDSERIAFDEEASILQQKIERLFWIIISVCCVICGIYFVIMIVWSLVTRFFIEGRPWSVHYFNYIIRILGFSISVSSYGIPESILLVVPITLFITFKKLYKENISSRRLHKCETMGNVSSICFDKTGTLTTNKMEVVLSHLCDQQQTWTTESNLQALPNNILNLIAGNISINSSTSSMAHTNHGNVVYENDTERALLEFVTKIGLNVQTIRDANGANSAHVYSFNSDRKLMGTVINNADGYRLFIKGASEIVLDKCNFMFGENGKLMQMTNPLRDHLQKNVLNPIASKRLRTITLAYRDFVTHRTAVHETCINCEPNWDDEENIVKNLTFLGILGIDDPIRPDAPETVKNLRSLGITVRMISGDDIETAKAVAIKCGIMEASGENVALDATEFNRCIRDKNGVIEQHLFNSLYPNLRVIARASPIDKYNLIDGLKRNREIVAMVGNSDGDALALKKADMGITLNRSVVAKDASTIILSDDKLDGIVRTVLWGRHCYDSIAKFVQFALSAKVVLVVIACLDAFFFDIFSCLNLNFLGIDFLLFILALISAFFTNKVTNDLSRKTSNGRSESIISKTMLKNICIQSSYQLFVLLTLLFVPLFLPANFIFSNRANKNLFVYNVFILTNFFNVFNSRKRFSERNIFDGIYSNPPLYVVWVGTLIAHVLQVQCVYSVSTCFEGCERLNFTEWIVSILLGCGILFWQKLFCFREKQAKQNLSEV